LLSWIILGGIALIFGLQFGLPSDSLTLGADGIAEVHGEEIRNEDFSFQLTLASRFPREVTLPKEPKMRELVGVNEEILDGMVERILLAHEARKMGLAATSHEAEDVVLAGHVLLFGHRLPWLGLEEKFNYEIFTKNWLGPMRVAEPIYLEQQAEELLAQTLRDLIAASVLVPEPELRREYEAGATTISLRYARYELAAFADLVDPTPAQLDAYVAEHAAELEQRYESQKTRFTALPKQARLLLVRVDDTPEQRAALEAARAAVAAGTQRLAAVARAASTHDTATRGGDYGFIDEESQAASDLPDAVRKAVPGLATGAVSEVLSADGSLWLLQVTDRREGDVPKEQAMRELAEEGVREEQGRELARRAAEDDQNAVAGGTPLTDVFAQPGALGETTLFGAAPIEALPLGEGGEPAEGAPASAGTPTDPAAGVARPKAELRSSGPLAKGQEVPGLGAIPKLLDDAWAQAGEAELLDEVYEVRDALVVAGVESRRTPTDEEFTEQRQGIYDRLQRPQGLGVLEAWAKRRCFDAKGRGDIKVSEETVKRLTTYDTEPEAEGEAAAEPAKQPYSVCDRVGGGGGMLMMRLRY
jgi:peptidyl-prolyl cis-trans isomerase D